jgi:predicted nucleic acid-binding Zn ribbon protein
VSQKKNLVPIGDIVKAVFAKMESEKTLTREDVEEQWRSIAGPDAARHTRVAALRKGMLTVFVDSSGWLQQMSMQKRKLVKMLKSRFGKDKISGIHFKIGDV